jgi:hypothetical protein
VSQSERDALVVRGYLSEEDRDNGAAIKKAIEAILSDIELDETLSPFGVAGRGSWLASRRERTFVKSIKHRRRKRSRAPTRTSAAH